MNSVAKGSYVIFYFGGKKNFGARVIWASWVIRHEKYSGQRAADPSMLSPTHSDATLCPMIGTRWKDGRINADTFLSETLADLY